MIFQINDMRLKARLASAAAATVITAMMLVCVGLGFPPPATAQGVGAAPSSHLSAGTPLAGRFE